MKQPEIYNWDNKATFSVIELKKFSEEFANKCQDSEKGDLRGFWDLCKEMFKEKFENNKPL